MNKDILESEACCLTWSREEGLSEELTFEQNQGGVRHMDIFRRTFQVQEEHVRRTCPV